MSEVRTRFSPRLSAEERGAIAFEGPGRTKQSLAQETDINAIIRRHAKTGVVTHLNRAAPRYGDFSAAASLHEALNLVFEAEEEFMSLPSSVRKACEHSPVRLLELLATEEGTELLVEAGLDDQVVREEDPPLVGGQEVAPAEPDPSGEPTPDP